MSLKKKIGKKGKPKPVKAKPIKAVKRKAVKGKAVKRKAVAKKVDFDSKVAVLHSELGLVRSGLAKNDAVLSKKLTEKIRLENSLNSLLRKNFAEEKRILSSLKTSTARKQEGLRQEISSLEKVNKVYAEKKARIDQAKKKQNALEKQLLLLEKRAGA